MQLLPKSQGSTVAYQQGYLNRSPARKLQREELSTTYISGSILYLTFPYQKS